MALGALKGVGAAELGEWERWSGEAYHVKRRLREEEQGQVGEAMDIRGSQEAEQRRVAMVRYLPVGMRNWRE